MKASHLSLLLALALPAGAAAQQTDTKPASVQQADDAKKKAKEPKFYELGVQVPEKVTMVDIDGKKSSAKDLRGKYVALVWYAKDCPAIVGAQKRLAAMAKEAAQHKDVVMIAVASDRGDLSDAKPEGLDEDGKPKKPYAKLRKHIKDKNIDFKIVVDKHGKLARKFKAATTPHVFVLDPKGVVVYEGALDNDPRGQKNEKEYVNYALTAIKDHKTDGEVRTKTTRPYG